MDKAAFISTRAHLEQAGFVIDGGTYDDAAFGSWWLTLHEKPRLRVLWDGRDGWVLLQRETNERFQGSVVWHDLWIGRARTDHTVETILAKVREACVTSA